GNPFVFNEVTKYRKIQDTVEGDYQFNDRYAAHFGYRYGTRRIEEFKNGFGLNANLPAALVPTADEETNHTNAFFGGFKARPVKAWTLYFDAEHRTADNVFTRVGNYDYTNLRARSRYAPTRKLSLYAAYRINKDTGQGNRLADPTGTPGFLVTSYPVSFQSPEGRLSIRVNHRLDWNVGYQYYNYNESGLSRYNVGAFIVSPRPQN